MNCVALLCLLFIYVMDGNESVRNNGQNIDGEVPLETVCNEEREARNRAKSRTPRRILEGARDTEIDERNRHREYQQEHRLREEERRSIACNWDITEDEFFGKRNRIEKDDERKRFFNDIEQDPAKATLLFHLNSGYARFGGTRMTLDEASPDEEKVEIERLEREILDEKLSHEEEMELLHKFYKEHNYNAPLKSCGACGTREAERGKVKYHTAWLSSMGPCKWPFVVANDFPEQVGDKRKVKMVSIPIDKHFNTRQVNAWSVKSLYYSERLDKTFYLHPELVEREQGGEEEVTWLCDICNNAILDRPELSLANGVDFGDFRRIGLEPLNVHEQVILGQMRLYSKFVKIRRNIGHRSDYSHCRIQAHAVLFEDDSPVVAAKELFNPDRLKGTIRIHFVGPKGENDWLLKETMKATTLLARPYVLYQWIAVCRVVNPSYSELEIPKVKEFTKLINDTVHHILDNAVYSNDETDMAFEECIGADVAEVRSHFVDRRNDRNDQSDDSTNVPVPHAYIMKKCMAGMANRQRQNNDLLKAAAKVFTVESDDEISDDESSVCDDNMFVDSNQESNDMSISDDDKSTRSDGMVDDADSTSSSSQSSLASSSDDSAASVDPKSYREKEPQNEYDVTEYALCTAFPDVFMFGTAYNRAVANISPKERHHLLHQFTRHPGRNRQLLGYLFDCRQRHENIRGIDATVKGRRSSIEAFAEMRESETFQSDLEAALEESNGKIANRILDKLMPVLNFAGRKTSGGAMELSGTKSRITEMAKRYTTPSLFLTGALDDINNPLAMRLTIQTLRQDCNHFPSKDFDLNKERNEINDFIDRGTVDVIGRGTVDCSYRMRAMLAMDNPVEYVSEYKACMYDILSILLGLDPSSTTLRSDSDTIRKTRYYADRGKGMAGHTLAFNGVTEDHKKGTLHFHLVAFGGLSPQILQRAAGTQELCNAISEVLNSQFRAKLPTRDIQELIFQKSFQECNIPLEGRQSKRAVLLEYAYDEALRGKDVLLKESTVDQAKRQQYHDPHGLACMEGFNGHTGCRFFKPSNYSDGTRPVQLVAEDEVDSETGKKSIGEITALSGDAIQARWKNTLASFDVRTKPDDRLIVWELDRPKLKEENKVEHAETEIDMAEALRKLILQTEAPTLQQTLEDFLKDPSPNSVSKLYNKITEKMDHEGNGSVVEHLVMMSLCTGSHNNAQILGSSEQGKNALFYTAQYLGKQKARLAECLTVLSGAQEHIKKYPSKASDRHTSSIREVQHLLTRVLNQLNILQELSDYQVAASLLELPVEVSSDSYAYIRPSSCLAFVLNEQASIDREHQTDAMIEAMNDEYDRMERRALDDLGEFIVEDLDEEETEEAQYVASGGHDDRHPEQDKKRPATASHERAVAPYYVRPEMYESLGPAPVYTINDGGIKRKQAIPYPYHYSFRGKALRNMSRLEYAALVRVGKKRDNDESSSKVGRLAARQFQCGAGHVLQAYKAQFLKAKQETVICCGAQPPFPGEKPSDDNSNMMKQWQAKADRFAAYVLILFRPESDCYDSSHKNEYKYDWNELSEFVEALLNSNSLLSKLRLRAMQARVHGLRSSFRSKLVLTKYRGMNRKMWDEEEKQKYARQRALEASRTSNDRALDEYVFREANATLSKQKMTHVNKQLLHCKEGTESMDRIFAKFDNLKLAKFNEDVAGKHNDDSLEEVNNNACLPLDAITISDKFEALKTATSLPSIRDDKKDECFEGSYGGNICASEVHGCDEQEHIRKLFEKYLKDPDDDHQFAYLLTGLPGAGKSHVTKMLRSFTAMPSNDFGPVKTFAFQGIAAISIDDSTNILQTESTVRDLCSERDANSYKFVDGLICSNNIELLTIQFTWSSLQKWQNEEHSPLMT